MSEAWEPLRAALNGLLAICEEEQKALVTLDAPKLAPLQIRKAEQVRLVARCYKESESFEDPKPEDLARLAHRCQRINASNRQMLVITLKCLDSVLNAGQQRKPKYGPGDGLRYQIMDLKV